MDDTIDGYPILCIDKLRIEAESEAIAASTKSTKPTPSPESPDATLTPEQELIAAGWVHIPRTNFWRSPKFQLYPTTWLALEMLRSEQLDLPEFRVWIEQLKTHYICKPEKETP